MEDFAYWFGVTLFCGAITLPISAMLMNYLNLTISIENFSYRVKDERWRKTTEISLKLIVFILLAAVSLAVLLLVALGLHSADKKKK